MSDSSQYPLETAAPPDFGGGFIEVVGAHEHNLKDVDVRIPKRQMVAFTGVSGSGKSSLVFDTVYAEAFRRFAEAGAAPVYVMGSSQWSRTSRPAFRAIRGLPPVLGLSQRQGVAGKLSTVGTISGIADLLRVWWAAFGEVYCKNCDIPLRATPLPIISEQIFESFQGEKILLVASIAEKRKGAFQKEIEKFRQMGFSKLRVNEEVYDLQAEDFDLRIDHRKLNTIEVLVDQFALTPERKSRLERCVQQTAEYAKGVIKVECKGVASKYNTSSQCPQCGESAPRLDPRSFSHSSMGKCAGCGGSGAMGEELPGDLFPCETCQGTRLTPDRPPVRVQGFLFEEVLKMPLAEALEFVEQQLLPLSAQDKSRQKVVGELLRLLKTNVSLGIGHLTLNRAGGSLAPGELQRIRLSSMISNRLNGALYVMDEPCQAMTEAEVKKLVGVLSELQTAGASLLAVEHHPAFLRRCDWIYTMGPGAGHHGGHVTHGGPGTSFDGTIKEKGGLKKPSPPPMPTSFAPLDEPRRGRLASVAKDPTECGSLVFQNIRVRNLSIPKLKIPEGGITLIRGPSGAGKTTFVEMCLLPALCQVLGEIPEDLAVAPVPQDTFFQLQLEKNPEVKVITDVRPGSLMRTSRRTVASALDVLVPFRELYAHLPQSQVMGLTDSHFSWNSKLGRCLSCEGRGYVELYQKYGPPVRITCESCLGAKLCSRSLVPRYRGLNFDDLLSLSLEEARSMFAHVRTIEQKLGRACDFGLGYVKLNQGMDSLSGGELQRLSLTLELKRSQLRGAWFVLMHPGTGLHKPDIEVLGQLLQVMKNRGASFVLVENREEFLPWATQVLDWPGPS